MSFTCKCFIAHLAIKPDLSLKFDALNGVTKKDIMSVTVIPISIILSALQCECARDIVHFGKVRKNLALVYTRPKSAVLFRVCQPKYQILGNHRRINHSF